MLVCITGFSFAYLVSFGMAFLVSTFIVFVVSERAIKAKQSQFIAGVGATNFWLSTFLWDALCFIIPSVLIIAVILAFQSSAYSTKEIIGFADYSLDTMCFVVGLHVNFILHSTRTVVAQL